MSSIANTEKPVIGAQLTTKPTPVAHHSPSESMMSTTHSVGSALTLAPTNEKAGNTVAVHSLDARRPSEISLSVNPFDTDIEAMISHGPSDASGAKSLAAATTRGGSDCQVWPGQDHWRQKAKAAKRSRANCTCMAGLSKRNRIIAQALIGLLIVGIAVGVGVGISKPLGAGVWHQSYSSS